MERCYVITEDGGEVLGVTTTTKAAIELIETQAAEQNHGTPTMAPWQLEKRFAEHDTDDIGGVKVGTAFGLDANPDFYIYETVLVDLPKYPFLTKTGA